MAGDNDTIHLGQDTRSLEKRSEMTFSTGSQVHHVEAGTFCLPTLFGAITDT